jgi:hypothetical protein
MRKWFVITGLIVIVFVVLAGVVLGSLNSLIDRNKQYILAQVKEAVGDKTLSAKLMSTSAPLATSALPFPLT